MAAKNKAKGKQPLSAAEVALIEKALNGSREELEKLEALLIATLKKRKAKK